MRFIIISVLNFLVLGQIFAQMQHFERVSFPVTQNGQALRYPFAGGVNSAQLSAADLNNDGILDLVIFDRVGNAISTYINKGTAGQTDYDYAPEYACFFPPCVNWMLLRDYNGDGAADIYCSSLMPGSQEVQVFKGYFENNILKFTPFKFSYPACPTCIRDYIYYPDEVPGFWNNLPIANSDLPDINDIDGDGDLDILTFEASVGGHVWLLENKSVEKGFGRDSLIYEVTDKCWGRFYESGLVACKNSLSADPNTCPQGLTGGEVEDRDGVHPGSTVMTYDKDGDGDKEIVLGDISFACLNMMTNGGSADLAWMAEQDTMFPANNVPVDLVNFPAAFYLDLNNDGKKDLVASPNSKNIIEDQKCVWYYPNNGTVANHKFEFQTKGLFVGEMIDVGTVAHPVFVDVNSDGLLDIVVGNGGFYTFGQPSNARLFLYLNVGTSAQPQFVLTDSDWVGMSQFAPNDYEFSPAFGDLDNDGDLDLLVGGESGWLYHYENTAGAGNPMNMVLDSDPYWLSLDVGKSSTPYIIDLDNDGLKDLVVGERQGNINFYKNIGTANQSNFPSVPTLELLGKINTRVPPESTGYSTPTFAETANGLTLITGTQVGRLEAYKVTGVTNDSFPVISETWGFLDEGARTHPALADIDNDGVLEVLIGNQRGGLSIFRTELVPCGPVSSAAPEPLQSTLDASLFPNPAKDLLHLAIKTENTVQWQITNLIGQILETGTSTLSVFDIPVSAYPSGIYTINVRAGAKRNSVKFIKI